MLIVHLVMRDKFTDGYIGFMNKYMTDYRHIFYTLEKGFPLSSGKSENLVFVPSFNVLLFKNDALMKADKIIISGLFFLPQMLAFMNRKVLKKTYIHLWGADFYCLENNSSIKRKILNGYRKYFITYAGGIINLIPNDYEKLCKFCIPRGAHYVAPMCGDGSTQIILDELHSNAIKNDVITILIGNSATPSNQHIEVFDMLKRFRDENIQIICPLSYGDKTYADEIIKIGKQAFGTKFKPLVEYIEKEEYFKIIAKSSIAIYNVNRQQAMGNIGSSLALGCKVFIRHDTSMWDLYKNERCYNIYDIEDIYNMSFEEFVYMPPELLSNWDIFVATNDMNRKITQWKTVLDSAV